MKDRVSVQKKDGWIVIEGNWKDVWRLRRFAFRSGSSRRYSVDDGGRVLPRGVYRARDGRFYAGLTVLGETISLGMDDDAQRLGERVRLLVERIAEGAELADLVGSMGTQEDDDGAWVCEALDGERVRVRVVV